MLVRFAAVYILPLYLFIQSHVTMITKSASIVHGDHHSKYVRLYGLSLTGAIAWFLCSVANAAASNLASDQQALLSIRRQLNPSTTSLNNWNSNSSSPCAWNRVTCGSAPWLDNQTRVTALDLSSLGLNGTLPTGFSKLEAMASLNLSNNFFRGPISPDNIGNCTQLISLDLSSNSLSIIAASSDEDQGLTKLVNLQYLNLGTNTLISNATFNLLSLPSTCAQLQYLNLSHNFIQLDISLIYPWHDCSSLQSLDLSYNHIFGPLPTNLTSLPSLHSLELSKNQISGTIPPSICSINASSLHVIDISANNLTGTFPLSLINCLSLEYLDLSNNSIVGNIPSEVQKMISLQVLNLAENNFTGAIPAELGGLPSLEMFMAGSNQLTGSIPSNITECKNLTLLDLDDNLLKGDLPDFLGDMVSLQYIVLHSNAFSGTIPLTLLKPSSRLKFLDLSINYFSGSIPTQLVNLTSLQYILLAQNNFNGTIPTEIGRLKNLQFLDLSSNNLTGHIPSSIGELNHLLWLNLAFNNIGDQIPPQLGNCTSLLWLNLKSNSLTGQLPLALASMGQDPSQTFKLNAEGFQPPKVLGECSMLRRWIPDNNPPYSFLNTVLDRDTCKTFWLRLLTSSPLIQACSSSTTTANATRGYIQISQNKLTGPILSNMQANRTIFLLLSFNNFTGSLPDGLGNLPLLTLNVSHNMLSGPIPTSLGNNTCLTLLDLSYNNLSGSIPTSLGGLTQLTTFNVSFNPYLTGSIPSYGQFVTFTNLSYINDTHLCLQSLDGMRQDSANSSTLPMCQNDSSSNNGQVKSKKQIRGRLKPVYLFILMVLSCLTILSCAAMTVYILGKWPTIERETLICKLNTMDNIADVTYSTVCIFKARPTMEPTSQVSSAPSTITYTDILIATNNFGEENVIGCGGFGTVYKATLKNGTMVAIKKLVQSGSQQGEREFMAEMETLGTVEHENLVPLIACCQCGGEKMLVYKLIRNGSLQDWLEQERDGGARVPSDSEMLTKEDTKAHVSNEKLSWEVRVKIAKGCAKALAYLHHDCTIIHRDVKPSNILLDENFTPYMTDFGLARELAPGNSHISTMIAGTLGYVAPEYCHTWRATTKGDVYSFGVVMLELLTGQQPVSFFPTNQLHDGNLVDLMRLLVAQSRAPETWHPVVRQAAAANPEQVVKFMRLALACTSDRPEQRPSMQEVSIALENI